MEDFNQQKTGVPSGGGSQLPGQPSSLGAPVESGQSATIRRKWQLPHLGLLLRIGGISVLALLLIGGGLFMLSQRNKHNARASLSSQRDVNQAFNALQLPLDELVTEGALSLGGQNRTLTINGQLRANNTLVIAPTTQPSRAVTGQIYFDQGTNQLAYFNGTAFVPLTDQEAPANVQSLGGASGAIGVGGGLALVGGALSNAGVLSVQGVSGAVTLSGGNGISVNGTTIANIGVLSLGGQTGDIAVGAGLSASGGEIRNSGVVSLTAGTVNLVISNDGAGNLTISSVGGGAGTVASPGGTVGRIAKFTASQTIEDSLLSEAAGTVTANGNFSVTGSLSLGIALSVASGGTGATSAPGARTNLGAAASGANGDITSLSGLTTALSVVQGGTGATSLTANGVLVGNGTGAIGSVVAGVSGLCLMSNAGAPSWQACPGGSGGVTSLNGATGALSIAGATEAGGIITLNNASTAQKGIAQFNATNFTVASGLVNTIQNIDPTANPTFASINTSAVVPNGTPLTVGSASEDLTLQGTNVLIRENNGANTTTLNFAAPTANVTYVLQTAAAGTYDVCTSAGNCVGVGGTVSTPGGIINRLAKFTGSQIIDDSLISDDGAMVTVNGNLSVTGTVSLSTPLAITSGGTGAATAAGARTNLGAAASGANNDITSLSGLTTALSVLQGGTGATSLTTNGVLLGNGTAPISSLVAGGADLCLVSTAGAPVWQACPGSGGVTSVNGLGGALTIANATGTGSTITLNDASTSQKGIAQFNSTNFSVTSGNVNTIQNIHAGATPTFAGINTNSIAPSGPLTVGSSAQNLTLQGAATTITSTNGANTAALSFVAPTANVAYRLQTAAAGTYDVCTTAGNCTGIGGGVSTPGGTTNQLAKFTGAQTIGDSIISDNGTVVTVGGNLSVTGIVTLTTPLAVTSGGTGAASASGARTNLGAAASGANSDITSLSGLTTALSVVQGGTGTTALTANGVLLGNGTGAISSLVAGGAGECLVSTAGAPVWQACPGSGAGVDSLNGLTGALTLANASAAGATITINDASTSGKGIASFNSTNFTVTAGAVNTIQNIHIAATPTFGALTLSSSQATSPMLLINNTNGAATGNLIDLQLNGASRMAVTPAGSMTLSGTINGQAISSAASFTGSVAVAGAANLNGGASVTGTLNANTITPTGAMTIGATAQNLTLQGATTTISSTASGNTTSLAFQTPTANVTYRLQTAVAGTYDICTSAGNCAGTGGGVTTSGGTTNRLAKFTGGQVIGDSIITDNGSTVTVGGALAVNTITPSGAMTVGATGQDLTLQGAAVSLSATDAGITNTIAFATPSGSNKTITIPNASGTVAVSAAGPLQLDSSGNLTCPLCVTSGGGGGGTGAVDSLNGLSGALTLANATGSGNTITIDDASTSGKGIAQFNSTNFTVTGGVVNTVQDINTTAAPTFARLTVTSSQAANDMMVVNNANVSGTGSLLKLQLNGANRFTVDTAGNVVTPGTITSGTINGQTISSSANFTGSVAIAGAANLNGGASVTGTLSANTITPTAAMTVGSAAQNLTLQGAATSITSSSGANTTSLNFQTPTANVTYRLLTATAGTYDVCTTAGNCVGLGNSVTTAGGTTNALPKFTGAQTLGDSNISDNGTTVTIGVNLAVNTITPTTAMVIGATGEDLTLQGANVALTETAGGFTNTLGFATPSGSNKTITLPNASGTVAVSASGPLAIDASGNITCATCATGSAVSSLNGQTGAVTIANASGAGGTVAINDASTSQKGIAQFNSTNFSASGGVVNTIQDINTTAAPTFGRLTVTSSQATNDMFVVNNTNASGSGALLRLQLNGANRFTVDPVGNVVAAGTLTSGNINGQTISSAANFTGSVAIATTLNVNTIAPTAAMTVGATNQNLTLQGATTAITSTSGANTTTLSFQTPTANVTYRLLTATAGTYDVCTTAGNCVGVGGGVSTSGGTTNVIPKFTGSQTLGDSSISDNGTTVTIGVNLAVNTITPTAAMTIGAIGQDLTLQGANVALTETNSGFTNTLGFATPSGSNKTITLPNASGTVAVSASGPLSLDVNGNLTCASCVTSTGVTSLNGQTGAVTLANASAGSGTVTINDASTSQKGIAQFNSTNFSASSGVINTIQDINTTAAPTFGKLTITSSQASDDMLVVNNTNVSAAGSLLKLQLNGGNRFTVDGAGNVVVAGTITSQNINGQTISSAANFTGSVAVGTSVTANTSLLSPLLDSPTTVALDIGTANATVINLNENTTVASGKSFTLGGNLSMQPAADSTTLIDINTQGGANLLTVDSTNGRVGINKGGSTLPAYALDVTGDINSTTGYRVGGTAGTSVTCSGGQYLENLVAVGGIVTGGSCAAGATTATLQTAYTASTGGTTPEIKLGSTRTALDIQDADSTIGGNLLNIRAANGAGLGSILVGVGNTGQVTLQNTVDSTSAFRVLSSGSSNIFNIDTTNGRVGVGGAASFSKFEVIGGDAAIYNSGNNPRLILGDSTAGGQNGYLQWDSTNDYFRIESVGTNGLKINDNYVAIGNIFPDQPLKIANGSTLLAQVNTTGQAMYQNSANSTAAFRVLTSGGGNVFSVDTTNGRVGINLGGTTAPSYALDVSGDTNISGVYRVGGTAGTSVTCSGGQFVQNLVTTGGIVTGGSCVAGGTATLQTAYTASAGSTTPEIKLDSTRGALDIQDADSTIGGALLNVRASNGSGLGAALMSVGSTGAVTLQNSVNSSNAFLIKNAAGNSLLNFDTTTVNLISNASLETDTSGWIAQTGNTAGDPTISRVTTQASTGAASLQIVTNADINEGARIPVTLSASTQYTISVYVKGLSGFSTLSVGRSDNGTPVDCSTGNSISASQWSRYDCTFTTGGTISSSYVYVRQSDATARTFWIDGVQVQTGSSANPYQEGKASLQGGLVINALNSSTANDYGLTVMGTGQLGLGNERLFAVRNKNGQAAIEYAEQVNRTIIHGGSAFWGTSALEVAAGAADSQGLHLKAFSGQTADMLRLVSSAGGSPVRWAVGAGDYTDTSGIKIFNEIKPNFNPTASSTASFTGLAVNPIINFAGGGAGSSTALLINPTYTAAPSGDNLLADFQNGGLSVFKVSRTGAVTMKNSTNSTAAFEVMDTNNVGIFSVDTTNARAHIGSVGVNTDAILFVLDSMTNLSEPTGVDGAMYYNASMSRMRCYVEGMWRFCNDPPGLRWGYNFEEDFIGDVDIGIGWSTLTGGGTVAASPPDLAQRPGQYQLSTGTGTTGYASLNVGGGDLGQFFIKGGEEIEFAVKIPTLSTSGQEFDVRAGLCDTVGSCFLGLYVEYDRNSGINWRFGAASNTTGSENGSSKAVATGWTTFRIVALSSTSVDFYAKHESESNYTLLGNITDATDIPNNAASATFPMFHVQKSAGTTSRTINIDYFNIRNSLTDAR